MSAIASAMPALTNEQRVQAVQRALTAASLNRAGSLLMAGAGIGAGLRGTMGLVNMLTKRRRAQKPTNADAIVMDVPYPDTEKLAEGFFDRTTQPASLLWSLPLWTAAGIGGFAGGWKGVDHVLDRRRKQELDQNLQDAEQEYNQALLSEFDTKTASDGSLGYELEALYQDVEKAAVEKRAIFDQLSQAWSATTSPDNWGKGLGAYATFAGLAATGAGISGYRNARAKSRRRVLQKALEQRRLRQFRTRPSEVLARPVPLANITEESDALV